MLETLFINILSTSTVASIVFLFIIVARRCIKNKVNQENSIEEKLKKMIENKTYFIDRINSSKANKMTALYHYSGVGFKKAILNLGVFRKEDNKMVGVL